MASRAPLEPGVALPVGITITGDQDVAARLEALGRAAPRALSRALNRTLAFVNTRVVRALAADTDLPQKQIRRAIALDKATAGRLEAGLRLTGRRIPLIAFRARQTRAGVTYRLPGGRGLVPSGFLATMRSGHRGVFARVLPSRSRKQKPRSAPGLPIAERFGPSLPHAFVKANVFEGLRGPVLEAAKGHLAHEIEFLLSQRAARAAAAEA